MAAHPSSANGKYRRITELGRGGMATVYLTALDGPGGFQKLVVVKEMRPDLAEDPEFRRMFMEEARVAARLNHPNVVQTHEVLETAGTFGIVMEFLDGQPLNKLRTSARREVLLPLQLFITVQALAGLEHVHESGLVHRDVSPQNIFVTYAGDVKLLDFGIVKATDSSVQTAVGTLKGKLGYMAPEQVLGKKIDRRTDVFAMGVVLWEALTGGRLWANVPEAAILGRLASGSIPTARSFKSDLPEELDAICARAMQVDPEHRYQTAADFQAALESFIKRVTIPVGRRDLANLMTSLFAEQRQRLRAKVDEATVGRQSLVSAAELLPSLAALPPLHQSQSGATIPPTAVTSADARMESMQTGSGVTHTAKRPLPMGVVIGLAIAAALIFGVAIGAVARRPASVPSAAATGTTTAGTATATTEGVPATSEPGPVDATNTPATTPLLTPLVPGSATATTTAKVPPQAPPRFFGRPPARPTTTTTATAPVTAASPTATATTSSKAKPKSTEVDLGY